MSDGAPYLSVVVTARNDDHGGDLLGRMQIFMAGWLEQARRYGISSELIVVEWNPLPDRPRLIDVLDLPKDLGPCRIRFIEVPPELHGRYPHGDALPLYQMIAKNVGIRRSRGRFVLATNIDILFSDALARYLSEQRLQPGRMYRIDRHDAMSEVPTGVSVNQQLAYCESHLIRVNRREGTFRVTADGSPVVETCDVTASDSGISFGQGWFGTECHIEPQVFRWAAGEAELLLTAPPQSARALVLDLEPGPAAGPLPAQLELQVPGEPPVRLSLNRRRRVRVRFGSACVPKLQLLMADTGVRVQRDPRPLTFRLFHAAWESLPSGQPAGGLQAGLLVDGWAPVVPRLWHALMHVVKKLARGGPLVDVTVPVSPRLRRLLKFYVDSRGITGMARHPLRAVRSWRSPRPDSPVLSRPPAHSEAPDFLHTNACGDFTMISREVWFDLRGYAEWDLYSMNLDSLFCYAAHYGGAPEEMLAGAMRIYHIEHGSGSGWTPEGQAKLYARLAAKGLSFIENDDVLALAAQMRRWETPMTFNHEDWGLAAFELKETVVGEAG